MSTGPGAAPDGRPGSTSSDPPARWLEVVMTAERGLAERLSDALAACGAAAVSLADAGDEPVLEPAPGAAPLWSAVRITALVPAGADLAALRRALEATIAPCPPWSVAPVPERDWERSGLDRFGPMRFGGRLWVCPGWCEPPADATVVVRLDPGLAFGTGTHQTTALCLEWLDGLDLGGASVIDYGCGSGILSIAALALGAARVTAVDIDPQALTATRDNAARNAVADRLSAVATLERAGPGADLLVANILAAPLVDLSDHLLSLVRPGARIALSGLLAVQAATVRAAYGHRVAWRPEQLRDEWALLAGTVRG